ncbi:MAG: lysine--tRNA ligase [Kiritimatiellia bacterium]
MTELSLDTYRQQRLENMRRLEEAGYPPYGACFDRSGRLAEIKSDLKDGEKARAAGRLVSIRKMGKSIFAHIQDGSGRLQVYARNEEMGPDSFKAFKLLDIGDQVGVKGTIFTTRTGELTVKIASWTLLAKSLRPLPEKWHGLKDVEARYRRRYLDLIANPEVRELFDKRCRMLERVRQRLSEKGFCEVETPMLQARPGGAAARPFVTRCESLGSDMYLRIAPELYLKKLLVGGFDKVYELNRNFRNEGLSRTHNPEFTMLEIYEAYSDLDGMKELVVDLVTDLAKSVFGTLEPGEGELRVDLRPPWREVEYRDLIKEKMGEDWFDLGPDEMRQKAEGMGLETAPEWGETELTHEIYEKTIEKTLVNPTFVMGLPSGLVPLARTRAGEPDVADVFELEIGGQEIAPAYTELNDPVEQRRRFEAQGGEIDGDFMTALEYGMPPAGGMGIGIDRLIMVLSGSQVIRDVILFPQLRPEEED